MKPEYGRIYEEDCLAFMERMDAEIFDVIVTSPPYNINKAYSAYRDNRERRDYLDWMRRVAEAASRVLKENGSFFLNVGGKPSDPWLPIDVASEFRRFLTLQNVIHWIKHISIPGENQASSGSMNGDVSFGHFKPINSEQYLNQAQEHIFHFTKAGKTKLDKLAIGVPYQDKSNINRWSRKEDRRDRGNVWFIPYETKVGSAKNPMLHPAEFPVKLPYLCIKLHGIQDDTVVYDPFMGIGSTAVACSTLGVRYVGTEIDRNYIEIAGNRIAQVSGRGSSGDTQQEVDMNQ